MKLSYRLALLESALLIIAVPLYFFWLSETERSSFSLESLLNITSLLYAIPILASGFLLTTKKSLQWQPLKDIHELVNKSFMSELLQSSSIFSLFILSLSAGLSEELLFRGVLQVKIGIFISALLFGLLHYLSHLYFILATLIGLYFGWVYEVTGSLLLPMIYHALYDFFVLLRYKRLRNMTPPAS